VFLVCHLGRDNVPIKHSKKKSTGSVRGTGWKAILHVVVPITDSKLWGRVGRGTKV